MIELKTKCDHILIHKGKIDSWNVIQQLLFPLHRYLTGKWELCNVNQMIAFETMSNEFPFHVYITH